MSRRGGVKTVPLSWTWERYDVWCKSNKVEPDLKGFHDSFLQLQRAGKVNLFPMIGHKSLASVNSNFPCEPDTAKCSITGGGLRRGDMGKLVEGYGELNPFVKNS